MSMMKAEESITDSHWSIAVAEVFQVKEINASPCSRFNIHTVFYCYSMKGKGTRILTTVQPPFEFLLISTFCY